MKSDDILRTVGAIAASMIVIFIYMHYFGSAPPPPAPTVTAPALAPAEAPTQAPAGAPTRAAATTGAAQSAAVPAPTIAEPTVQGDVSARKVLRTAQQEVELTARGGRIWSWRLPEYARLPSDPSQGAVDLVSPEARAAQTEPMVLLTGDAALDATINEAPCVLDDTPPTAEDLNARKLPAGTQRVTFRWSDGAGLALSKSFYLPPTGYTSRVEWALSRNGQPVQGASMTWGPSISRLEQGVDPSHAQRGMAAYPAGSDVQRLAPLEAGDPKATDTMWAGADVPRWLALDDQYFALAVVPQAPGSASIRRVAVNGTSQLKLASAAAVVTVYAGPKADRALRAADVELGTNLSAMTPWGFWGFLAKPLYAALAFFHGYVGNWGWAIVILTVLIRLLFIPITHRSMVNMRKTQKDMARLQPKVQKIKDAFKDREAKEKDRVKKMELRRKQQEEMMELYKREGVNPMATLTGCLPMLLQMPVLIAMYTVLSVATDLRGAPFFGWIQDLSSRDPYWVTPIVMGVTMLVQQLMTMTKTEDPQQRAQQRMMLIVPVIFTYMFMNFAAGLVIYWLVNNLLSIAQQVMINRHADKPATATA